MVYCHTARGVNYSSEYNLNLSKLQTVRNRILYQYIH